MMRITCGRGCSPIEGLRPLPHVLTLLLVMFLSGGCGERGWSGEFERWPMAIAGHESARVVAYATGPSTITVAPSAVARFNAPILCLAPSPREGFLIFLPQTLVNLQHRDGVWGSRESLSSGHTVRQALLLKSGRLALLTAGDSQSHPVEPPAEAPPWLLGGTINLAWLENDRLVIGAPELEADLNAYRLKAGRFAGEDENLLVFVYTRAPFDDVMRRRPWIYRVIEGDNALPVLEPRWRGSSFSRPFRDAIFGDFTGEGEGEIAALEVARDGGRLLTAYRFKGFGLEGLAPGTALPDVEDRVEIVRRGDGLADELVVRANDGRFLVFEFDAEAEMLRQTRVIEGPKTVLGWMIDPASEGERGSVSCVLPGGGLWRDG